MDSLQSARMQSEKHLLASQRSRKLYVFLVKVIL
jgi:hypothetical protein